jgi:protein-disulfide isomerase
MNKEQILNYIKHPITISILVLLIGITSIWGILNLIPREEVVPGERREHFWGVEDSEVVIEVYKDFQCPGCKLFWQETETLLRANYENRIKFVFNHYPLNFHPRAARAAEAAEAAGEQGKFFEYANILFDEQPTSNNLGVWTDAKLIEYASRIEGLNVQQFEESLKSRKYRQVVQDHIRDANARGVSSTPTVFLNGRLMQRTNNLGQATVADYATLAQEIDKILESQEGVASEAGN